MPKQQARLGGATKKPRKAVLARPRAAHVRPWKSGDECETFPHMCPTRAALVSSRGRALTVWRCLLCPWTVRRRLPGVGLVCWDSRVHVAGVPVFAQIPGLTRVYARPRGPNEHAAARVSSKRRKKVHQSKRVFPRSGRLSIVVVDATQWQKVARQSPTTARKLSQPI